MNTTNRTGFSALRIAGVLAFAAMASTFALPARAQVELIPSIGATKSTDSNAGDAKGFGGLALRAHLLPFLAAEGGIAYRQDSFLGGDVKVRQWPVTASAWLTPVPAVYVGGGVGWYRTTYDYSSALPISDTTTRKLGTHVGGGVDLPIAANLGLDLSGRYVFMSKEENNVTLPTQFNPDFWNFSAGLAIKF